MTIPLVAMQFSDEVNWDLKDFIIIAGLLIGAGFVYEFIANQLKSGRQRITLGTLLVAAVLVVWVELAVGIFD